MFQHISTSALLLTSTAWQHMSFSGNAANVDQSIIRLDLWNCKAYTVYGSNTRACTEPESMCRMQQQHHFSLQTARKPPRERQAGRRASLLASLAGRHQKRLLQTFAPQTCLDHKDRHNFPGSGHTHKDVSEGTLLGVTRKFGTDYGL